MRISVSIVCFVLCVACSSLPHDSGDVHSARRPDASASLAHAVSERPAWIPRVDALFAEWDIATSPGCALAVIQNGSIVHARGFGSAHLEHALPITPRSVFDIGSTSKQFTAACIGLLEQDQKLTVDDDVRKWVPELRDYGTPITLRMLLHHTSGLRDYCELFSLAGQPSENYTTKEQALALIARQRELNFTPGTEFLYSNTGYFLLSIIVERAAGKTLPEFAHERIFEPLAMKSTHIHDDHRLIVEHRAQAYAPRDAGGFGIDMSDFEQTGDGSVMTTVEDLALWDANFTSHAVGGVELFDFLHTRGQLASGKEIDYARGLMIRTWRGVKCVSHGGAWAGYRAELMRLPDQRTSIVVLCNLASMSPSDLAASVAKIVSKDALGPEPAEVPAVRKRPDAPAAETKSVDPTSFAGLYHSEELGVTYEFAVRGGLLFVGEVGQPTMELPPLAEDRFGQPGFALTFERDAAQRPLRIRLSTGRMKNLLFERTR